MVYYDEMLLRLAICDGQKSCKRIVGVSESERDIYNHDDCVIRQVKTWQFLPKPVIPSLRRYNSSDTQVPLDQPVPGLFSSQMTVRV